MNYYKLLESIRDKSEEIPDNDMHYFKERLTYKKRDIIPSEYYFNQYYLNKFDDTRVLSLHSEFINDDYDLLGYNRVIYPKNYEEIIGIYKKGKNYDQPIFNDDLLTDIKQNNKKIIYSKHK